MGALPLVFAATGEAPNGGYVGPDGFYEHCGYPKLVTPRPQATDDRASAELWALSERMTEFQWS